MRKLFFALLGVYVFFATTIFLSNTGLAASREELASELVRIFDVEEEGISPLFSYSDWAYVSEEARPSVAAAIKSGLYRPEGKLLEMWKEADSDDVARAVYGINFYLLTDSNHEKRIGAIVSKQSDTLVVRVGDGEHISIKNGTKLLTSEGFSEDIGGLKIGERFCLAVDEEGAVTLVWRERTVNLPKSINDFEIMGLYRGKLYLYDEPRSTLILTDAELLSYGEFSPLTGGKYFDLEIHPQARIVYKGRPIAREDINVSHLDGTVNIVLGEAAQMRRIVFVDLGK